MSVVSVLPPVVLRSSIQLEHRTLLIEQVRCSDAYLLSTALVFTLAHVQVSYTTPVGFLVVLFGLAIAWGWLMHKTGSLWGSTLFHAGADLLIILPIFSSLGAA